MFKSLLQYLKAAAVRLVELSDAPVMGGTEPRYQIYTTEFDETVDGTTLSQRLAAETNHEPIATTPVVNIDPEVLDSTMRLSRENARALGTRLQNALPSENRTDTVVALLFDHSGSLNGVRALVVAEMAEALADALTESGIATDILGFTTARWKGGNSRRKWLNEGRFAWPGRLNDLLHIIHLDGANGPCPGPHRFPAMRDDRIFKENIDGEAVEWAHARLIENSRRRKLLIVFSDGAPVDDSTLSENWPTILSNHLENVASRIEASKTVLLGGVGIEHAVGNYYPRSTTAENLSALATVVPTFVEQMVLDAHR
jgi:cobaltochelatase CobT